MRKYYIQLYRHTLSAGDEDAWVDAGALEIHPDLVQQLEEFGIVEIRRGLIPASQAARVQKVLRLRRSLGVNLPGAAIILELLERIEQLQDEIERLKRR
ncbi:hypothetical protein IT084_12570 [Desulfallas sp. Bu1-1]|uniref:chaperone modulator CbpM n=1 Tax=Desulfallas sp. Bu1-1 TaxID=2787620 RepID=UPI0018A10CE4|nr:chaperone modulator CbpM [Desulfallas sp. Bu1-1]MBF7083806.1 hypothetical protein [Desulfallas sp. Bu1-1]